MADVKSAKHRIPKRIWIVGFVIIFLMITGTVVARQVYDNGLGPVSSSQKTQIFVVNKGSTTKQIAVKLEEEKLIKSAWAFQLYVHSKDLGDKLQAGTYALSPNDGTVEIVNVLTKGQVETRLVTILPGRRIDQVQADFINSGFSPDSVEAAFNPANYADLPVMAFKPADVGTLEGLLWPDSYQKQPDTDPAVIIRQSLIDMGEKLTPQIQAAFAANGLSTYDGIKLASIIIQEVSRPADQAQASQVFHTRLKAGMKLESDATAKYGAVLAGKTPSVTYDSSYNTYSNIGLPPTPISTISSTSLLAAAYPASTNWLYFVSGDDGTTYFSDNLETHEALTKQHCTRLCGN